VVDGSQRVQMLADSPRPKTPPGTAATTPCGHRGHHPDDLIRRRHGGPALDAEAVSYDIELGCAGARTKPLRFGNSYHGRLRDMEECKCRLNRAEDCSMKVFGPR
jgi:hypothetical protein